MSVDTRNIVVLGASYSGLGAAHYFLKHVYPSLAKLDGEKYHVYLVNPSTHFYHRVAAPRATVSSELMPNSKTFHDIAAGFKQYDPSTFTFLQGKATSMDTAQRTVTIQRMGASGGSEQTLPYHALILATGTRTHAPALSLQGGLHEDTLKALSDMHKKLQSATSIVVAGGGPAGVETAGEIGEYLNGAAGWFAKKPSNPKATVTLISGAEKLLPILGPAFSKQADIFLARVGVDVVYKVQVTGTEQLADGRTKVILDNGKEMECDIYVPAVGVIPMTEYVPKELLTEKGYVKVNDNSLRVDEAGPRVYAIGDVGSYTRGGIMDIYEAIPVLLTNIKRDLLAAHKDPNAKPTGADRKYKKNTSETQVVPVGQNKGVGAFNGNKLPSIVCWLVKGRDYMSGVGVEAVTGSKWVKEKGWKPTDG
ncbi:hypothetical protein MBLNU459_g6148t1 [Dothideomycetes sp. NU459]